MALHLQRLHDCEPLPFQTGIPPSPITAGEALACMLQPNTPHIYRLAYSDSASQRYRQPNNVTTGQRDFPILNNRSLL